MIEPTPLSEREARRIREVAKALVAEINKQGHVCLKTAEIATLCADMRTLKDTHAKVCDKLDTVISEVAQSRGEKKMAIAIVGFLGAVLGLVVGTLGVIFGR